MKYYVDGEGNYLGGTDGKKLSNNEVSHPPAHAEQKWNGTDYDAIPAAVLEQGKDDQVEAELGTNAVRVIIEALVPMIQDNSIAGKTPSDVLDAIKARRRAEL